MTLHWVIGSSAMWTGARAALQQLGNAVQARLDRHTPMLRAAVRALSFATLFGGAALAAYHSGLAHAAGALCGPVCAAIPGLDHVMAAAAGGAAVLAVRLYAAASRTLAGVFAVLVARRESKPSELSEPEPLTLRVQKAVSLLYGLIGIALGLTIGVLGKGTQSHAAFEFWVGWTMGAAACWNFSGQDSRRRAASV
jgi:hypothetical protein